MKTDSDIHQFHSSLPDRKKPSHSPLRIAIICRKAQGLNGTKNTVLQHAQRLVEMGHSVHVVGERLDLTRCQ